MVFTVKHRLLLQTRLAAYIGTDAVTSPACIRERRLLLEEIRHV